MPDVQLNFSVSQPGVAVERCACPRPSLARMRGSPLGFDRALQTYRLGHGNEGGESRVPAHRQSAMQALALNGGRSTSYFVYNVSMLRQITTVSTKGQFVIRSEM